MSDFKTRLIKETAELDEKTQKLTNFLLSEKFKDVEDVQQALLSVQLMAMKTYSRCLKERIHRLDG